MPVHVLPLRRPEADLEKHHVVVLIAHRSDYWEPKYKTSVAAAKGNSLEIGRSQRGILGD